MQDDEKFDQEWEEVEPAPKVRPLKAGEYICSVSDIRYRKANTGTEGVDVHFVVEDGEYKGIAVPPHQVWARGEKLSDKAKQMAKRDLEYLGFTSFKQIQDPPKVDTSRRFEVTVSKDTDSPMGKVYCFSPK